MEGSNRALQAFVERVEHVNAEIKALLDDRASIYDEAGAAGLDPILLREMVRLRKMAPEKRRRVEDLRGQYMLDLGL